MSQLLLWCIKTIFCDAFFIYCVNFSNSNISQDCICFLGCLSSCFLAMATSMASLCIAYKNLFHLLALILEVSYDNIS